jgi:DNA-binding MarR family transcriptional regulator
MSPVLSTDLAGLTDQEMHAWAGFLRVHAAVVRRLDGEMQAAHGITLTQYEVLLMLATADGGERRLSDLADGALLSLSGLSRLVDRLVARGLVERRQCPDDRRSALAHLTREGRECFMAARPMHLDGVRRLFIEPLPPGGVQALAGAWDALEGAGD